MALKANWFGYSAPFYDNGNVLPFQTDERLIKNDLLQLLLTSPGERFMRPNFGTGINNFTFENINNARLNQLRDNIINSIKANDKRVIVRDVTINNAGSNNVIINIQVSLTASPLNTFTVEIALKNLLSDGE